MKIAVVGTGRMAAIRLAALRCVDEVVELVVASNREGARKALASEVGATECAALELPDDLDALVVCTKTSEHVDGIELAIARSLPVFCEKPLALGVDETVDVLARASEAGVEVQVGFHRRFDPEISRIRELWASGDLGTPYVLRLASHDHELTPDHYIPTSGGIWRDLHIHDFDLIRFLSGEEIETVVAHGAVRLHDRFAEHGDSDTSAALVITSGGLPCMVTGTRHNPGGYDVRVEAICSRMSVAAGIGPRAATHLPGHVSSAKPWAGFADRFADAFVEEMRAFVALVAGRATNRCPGAASVEALRAAIGCEQSAGHGCPVSLETVAISEVQR